MSITPPPLFHENQSQKLNSKTTSKAGPGWNTFALDLFKYITVCDLNCSAKDSNRDLQKGGTDTSCPGKIGKEDLLKEKEACTPISIIVVSKPIRDNNGC